MNSQTVNACSSVMMLALIVGLSTSSVSASGAESSTLKRWVVVSAHLHHKNKVIEVDPAGKEVWSLTKVLQPYAAQRLENGNTLITQRGLREIDPNGKTVWQIPNLSVTRFHRLG